MLLQLLLLLMVIIMLLLEFLSSQFVHPGAPQLTVLSFFNSS